MLISFITWALMKKIEFLGPRLGKCQTLTLSYMMWIKVYTLWVSKPKVDLDVFLSHKSSDKESKVFESEMDLVSHT